MNFAPVHTFEDLDGLDHDQVVEGYASAELSAVEPNAMARQRIHADGVIDRAHDGTANHLPFQDGAFDLAFTSGVLIHVNPDDLAASCREISRVSKRYVLCAEYFSVQAREIKYRGHDGALFTRDFGKLYMETCPELKLVDYGFFWTGAGCVDDLTWWVFEKPQS